MKPLTLCTCLRFPALPLLLPPNSAIPLGPLFLPLYPPQKPADGPKSHPHRRPRRVPYLLHRCPRPLFTDLHQVLPILLAQPLLRSSPRPRTEFSVALPALDDPCYFRFGNVGLLGYVAVGFTLCALCDYEDALVKGQLMALWSWGGRGSGGGGRVGHGVWLVLC